MYVTRLSDPGTEDYQVHKLLMDLSDGKRVLFQRRGFEIHVLSDTRLNADSRDVTEVINGVKKGGQMLFTIRLNPVVTRFIDGKNRRVALPPAEVSAWAKNVFRKNGFDADFTVKIEGCRRSARQGSTVTLFSVLAGGVLTVNDVAHFRSAVRIGIGHAKGLGFGMLNVFEFA